MRVPAVHTEDAPALSVRDLWIRYDGRAVLRGITFDLEPGDQLAVVGPNGAGKSTLLKGIAGLLSPDRGTIEIHGHEPKGHICIAYVPQRSAVDWRFPVTVTDVVLMGRTGRLGPVRRPRNRDRQLVDEALESVGLRHLGGQQIERLSGGQQQRMFIARALAQQAELLLMDEPFAGLDIQSRDDVLSLLPELRMRRVTVLVALHDLGLASSHFDHVLMLKESILGFGAPADVFTPPVLRTAYGSCLRLVEGENGVLVVHDTGCTEESP